jgi:hypothetical protein
MRIPILNAEKKAISRTNKPVDLSTSINQVGRREYSCSLSLAMGSEYLSQYVLGGPVMPPKGKTEIVVLEIAFLVSAPKQGDRGRLFLSRHQFTCDARPVPLQRVCRLRPQALAQTK